MSPRLLDAVNRRDFLKAGAAAGAGLLIAIYLPSCAPGSGKAVTTPFKPNAWVRISTDGTVTLVVDRSEMGQGVTTALPMILAEELDVAWKDVKFEQALASNEYANQIFGIMGTGGSTSVRAAWGPLREAGAKARAMLVAAAAARWKIDPALCHTEAGHVVVTANGERLSYGELAEEASKVSAPAKVKLKDPKDFKIIGTPAGRLDLAGKVNGTAIFGIDVRIPGMLIGVVARAPNFGATVKSWDGTKALQVPGVREVIKISSGVAVLADSYWQAAKGRAALVIKWSDGPHARLTSDQIRRQLIDATGRPGNVATNKGNVATARGAAVEAVYHTPFLAHATMEPMNATAHVEAGKCTVWAPTQFQFGEGIGGGTLQQAARITGLDPSKVTVHTTYLGGGFGRRFFQDFVIDAVECSNVFHRPVKVIWSREDDIRHDFFRPAFCGHLSAKLDAAGRPVAFAARIAAPSLNPMFGMPESALDPEAVVVVADQPYDIPNVHVEGVPAHLGVPIGPWRSVGASATGFLMETFIDECAAGAKADPFEYRRALLTKQPRHRAVLELAALKAGWGSAAPAGHARGIAVVSSFGSYVAEVAEVSLRADGTVQVHRVVAAVDCGMIVNPDIVAAQVESAIVFGLTAALHGEITIDKGAVVQGNLDTYPLLRMSEMPMVEVHIVKSEEAPTGIGEPGTPPIAAAVGNALYALTGKRVRELPIRRVAG